MHSEKIMKIQNLRKFAGQRRMSIASDRLNHFRGSRNPTKRICTWLGASENPFNLAAFAVVLKSSGFRQPAMEVVNKLNSMGLSF